MPRDTADRPAGIRRLDWEEVGVLLVVGAAVLFFALMALASFKFAALEREETERRHAYVAECVKLESEARCLERWKWKAF